MLPFRGLGAAFLNKNLLRVRRPLPLVRVEERINLAGLLDEAKLLCWLPCLDGASPRRFSPSGPG